MSQCPSCGRPLEVRVDQFGNTVLYCEHDGTRIHPDARSKNPNSGKGAHYDAMQESQRD